jgi:hypothetical protein
MSHVVLSATVCVKVPTHGAGPAALRIPADARVIWSELALPDSALPSLVLGFLEITRSGDVRALPHSKDGSTPLSFTCSHIRSLESSNHIRRSRLTSVVNGHNLICVQKAV